MIIEQFEVINHIISHGRCFHFPATLIM